MSEFTCLCWSNGHVYLTTGNEEGGNALFFLVALVSVCNTGERWNSFTRPVIIWSTISSKEHHLLLVIPLKKYIYIYIFIYMVLTFAKVGGPRTKKIFYISTG